MSLNGFIELLEKGFLLIKGVYRSKNNIYIVKAYRIGNLFRIDLKISEE